MVRPLRFVGEIGKVQLSDTIGARRLSQTLKEGPKQNTKDAHTEFQEMGTVTRTVGSNWYLQRIKWEGRPSQPTRLPPTEILLSELPPRACPSAALFLHVRAVSVEEKER